MNAARGLLAIAAIGASGALLAGCGGGVPSTVQGKMVTGAATSQLEFGSSASCGLNLPVAGTSQILLKADGTVVATATPGPVRKGTGDCWVNFTFTGVPGGKTLYEVTVTNTSTGGCHGTVYYKPAQLARPITLTC